MKNAVSFTVPVQTDLQAVEALMRAQAQGYHPDLIAAWGLILAAGGKRVRPTLTLLAGKMLAAPHDLLVTLAAAIEMLHTATLVHDDLIDGSLLRRGMPTLNARWSPGATVLTGDFVFARAAQMAAATENVPVIKLFAQTLTVIVNGEVTQLLGSRCHIDRAGYDERIYAKTASLFETSVQAAGLIADAPPAVVEALRVFGYETGMAFQIVDDILDFTGDQVAVGKPVGSDLRQGIVTLPALRYAAEHPEDEAIGRMTDGQCLDDTAAEGLIERIRMSAAIGQAYDEAAAHVERALAALEDLPPCAERDALESIARYTIARER